jgi:hypothetical protein
MLKKNIKLILVTLVLAAVTVWLVTQNRSGTVREELRNFAVKDTASVTKIFLADRAGKTIELEREGTRWRLNKKYYARRDAIKTLLETLKNISVRSMIAKSMYNTVIKQLSTGAIKCEVYMNGKKEPDKIIYVGGETKDSKGTYMMLENSSVPFVTEIPGFEGYLTPRFFLNEAEWRDKSVFDIGYNDIRSVEAVYNPDSARSFRIDFNSENNFAVSSPVTGQKLQKPDTAAVVNYLSQFTYLNFEFFDFMMKEAQRDSMLKNPPVCTFTITDKKGKDTRVKFYNIQVNPFTIAGTDTSGVPAKYDVDRLYAFINNDKELVGVQIFVFGKIFRQLSDFDATRRKPKTPAR